MSVRYTYVGLGGLLLTLACGSKVEIGHGNEGGSAGSSMGMAGSNSAGEGVGGSIGPGGESSGASSGTGQGATATGGTYVGGPIPTDNGPQREVDQVDLLLAIDNSLSMGEKQKLLVKAVPELVQRLVNPRCVDGAGNVVSQPASPSAACPGSSQRETKPLRDLHIGVITSSLGSHGSVGASDVCTRATENDYAHLLPLVRGLPSYDGQGYLKWDPDALANPPGESDAQALASSLGDIIASAGESGCGLEAQLESVYRFLVDPEPYQTVELTPGGSLSRKVGVDSELLQQRQAFLRPSSSVVVLMLTDENDCSVIDEGYGWLVTRNAPDFHMYRSTSQCHADPNDACCQSCGEVQANEGCPELATDSECAKDRNLDVEDDNLNLRCFDHKRRFGFDLLYPTARYVSGFGGGMVPTTSGVMVHNPLFHQGAVTRDPSLFTFALIGGMPWQDVATPASLSSDTLELLTPSQLESQNRWPMLIGSVASNIPPLDPFMRESIGARSGTNPVTNDDIVPETSQDPAANDINGHDHDTLGSELQYACTFDLPEPVECDQASAEQGLGCDCYTDELSANRAVCNPPGGGAPTTTQYKGKAYPTLRELRVARELGRRTVVGSVCSRNTSDDTQSDYGYRPIFEAIGRRVADTLVKP